MSTKRIKKKTTSTTQTSMPTTATMSTKKRNLFLLITALIIVFSSVVIGLWLYNSNKEYQMSKLQREVNATLEELQEEVNSVPDDPRMLAYSYEDTDFFKKGDPSFYEDIPATLLEYDITPVDEEYQRRVDEIGEDVLDFINTTYHTTWKYYSVPTCFYADDMEEILGKYYPEENILAFNTNGMFSVYDLDQVAVFAVAAHEEIHYLMKLNLGTPFCKLYNEENQSTGTFLHEAVVEEITYAYLRSKGIYPLQIHGGEPISSSYEMLLYNLEEFKLIFDCDIVSCMLMQDHATPSNILAAATGDEKAYVRWLYWMDNIMYAMWDKNHPAAMHVQGVLNQFYIWCNHENTETAKEFVKLTNYYMLRCYFIKTTLRTEPQCIEAWFKIEEIERNAIWEQIQLQEIMTNFDS